MCVWYTMNLFDVRRWPPFSTHMQEHICPSSTIYCETSNHNNSLKRVVHALWTRHSKTCPQVSSRLSVNKLLDIRGHFRKTAPHFFLGSVTKCWRCFADRPALTHWAANSSSPGAALGTPPFAAISDWLLHCSESTACDTSRSQLFQLMMSLWGSLAEALGQQHTCALGTPQYQQKQVLGFLFCFMPLQANHFSC